MSNKKHKVAPEVKQQILDRVKAGNAPVADIATEHGVSAKTIYGWLAKGATAQPSWPEYNKLKKENQALKELIGELTWQMNASEKKAIRG